PAADDHQDFVDRVGVEGVHLALGIALELDGALRGKQVHDRGIEREFGPGCCDDLCHAACSVFSICVVLPCASFANGQPAAWSLSSRRKYCWYSRPSWLP